MSLINLNSVSVIYKYNAITSTMFSKMIQHCESEYIERFIVTVDFSFILWFSEFIQTIAIIFYDLTKMCSY